MLAICEECSKKYNVDESRIKGARARFSCYECGHIIVVIKPDNQGKERIDTIEKDSDIASSM